MSTTSPQGYQHLGKYELRERLGRGGMAEVWKAFDTQLERYVAIKILHADLQADPEFITRFTREARVIASLHHPNIVQIHDFQISHPPESSASTAYMVMDYVEGPTLATYIRNTSRAGQFPSATDIVNLFASISRAIDYAHQKGMIHRDIKPANILLDKRNTTHNPMGEPVLTDFGIAKLMGATSGTMSGMWLGTPLYISPEQAQGHPGNERSDIYSLGVILYELCAGVQPFRGESVTAIMMQHVNSMPTPPALINPYIPPALAMVILRAMAKDPADRFSSASAMTAAMAEALNLPIPADLSLPAFPLDDVAGPTRFSPLQSGHVEHITPPGMISASPVSPLTGPALRPPPIAMTTPQFNASRSKEQGSSTTPINSTPASSSPVHSGQNVQALAQPQLPSGPPPPVPSSRTASTPLRGRKGVFIALLVLLLLAVSSLGALYAFSPKHPVSTTVATSPVVGDVFFLNSGQLNAQNSQGIEDTVQIDLHNVPQPTAGKSYYGWLLTDQNGGEAPPILLGNLPVQQRNVHYTYTDPQHTNLLSIANSFLVTEEDTNPPPVSNSVDKSTWRFYSGLPQAKIAQDKLGLNMLSHLRHLLSNSPELQVRKLYGGLAVWFWRNTEKIMEWGVNARDDDQGPQPDRALVHRQLIHVLDYIDGITYVNTDVPPHTPVLVNPSDAQVPLVGPPPDGQDPPGYSFDDEPAPGYVYLIDSHMKAAVLSPQATSAQRQLAAQIDEALNSVKSDLDQVRQDARQLAPLTDAQLAQPQALSLLNDLAVAATKAYTGSNNPSTGQLQGGADWIYNNIQRLATFEVQPYTSNSRLS